MQWIPLTHVREQRPSKLRLKAGQDRQISSSLTAGQFCFLGISRDGHLHPLLHFFWFGGGMIPRSWLQPEAKKNPSDGYKSMSQGCLRYLVPKEGLEPSLSLQEMDFESIASANSATPAVVAHSSRRKMPFKNVSLTALPKYRGKPTKASKLATFL
jgi:hypothetical protein